MIPKIEQNSNCYNNFHANIILNLLVYGLIIAGGLFISSIIKVNENVEIKLVPAIPLFAGAALFYLI